jgi:hypothetical protein
MVAANLALGDLAVMLEITIRQTGAKRNRARFWIGSDFDRNDVQGIDSGHNESVGANRAHLLAGATECFKNGDPRAAHVMRFKTGCHPRRGRLVPSERQNTSARLQMGNDALETSPVQRQEDAILQAPPEPRRRKRESGRRRQ